MGTNCTTSRYILIETGTGIVIHVVAFAFSFSLAPKHLIFPFFLIAFSIQTREIHFKRGQSEDYVTMVQVSFRFNFYWFASDTR